MPASSSEKAWSVHLGTWIRKRRPKFYIPLDVHFKWDVNYAPRGHSQPETKSIVTMSTVALSNILEALVLSVRREPFSLLLTKNSGAPSAR